MVLSLKKRVVLFNINSTGPAAKIVLSYQITKTVNKVRFLLTLLTKVRFLLKN